MKKRVIISSIYSSNTINPLLVKLSPTDLILVVEKDLDKKNGKDENTKKESIKMIKKEFGKILNIEILETPSLYNLYDISKTIVKKIDSLGDAEVMLNISEGRKTLSFGMYFAGYLRKEVIEGIYYLIKEDNSLLKMPFMNFEINKIQKEMLKKIEQKPLTIRLFKEKTGKSKSVFYKYLKDLESNGYVSLNEDEVKITETGKILLL